MTRSPVGSTDSSDTRQAGADEHRDSAAQTHGVRLASAVMFVGDLEPSVRFYCELLNMNVTVRGNAAAPLGNPDGFQLYLRSVGPNAQHALGEIVQYVIWTAHDPEDLRQCERFLRNAGGHVRTQSADGFTLVEGRDPSHLPVVITYPGPDEAVRHEIMSRIYSW